MKLSVLKDFLNRQKGWLVWTLRLLIGGVFILSGIAKGLDIWGFVYKIEEYLTVWHFMQPHSLCLVAAIAIAGAEFLGGMWLATGCYRRVAVWMLSAMMAVLLPLSLYIYIASPVPDCGCFGDFLVISNAATFWKNVVIVVGLAYLLVYNNKVIGIYHHYTQWIVAMAGFVYFLFLSLYGYMVQPMIDFRSFPVGVALVADEHDDVNLDYDTQIGFVYEKEGERKEFSIDSLPDSTWTFVSRTSHADDLPTDESTTELYIYDDLGEDVTADVIDTDGEQLIITLPDYRRASPAYTYVINELKRYIDKAGGSLIEITDMPAERLDRWRNYSMAQYPIYLAESTTIKELARGTMAVVYLREGVVVGKRNLGAVDPVMMEDDELMGRNPLDRLEHPDDDLFWNVTMMLVAFLAVTLMIQVAVVYARKRRKICLDSKKNN